MPGSAAMNPSSWPSVMISGGASRMTSGAAAFTRNPARARPPGVLGPRRGEHHPAQQSAPAHVVDERVTEPLDAVPQRLAHHLGVADQVVGRQHPQHRQRRRGADRIAAEGAAVQTGRHQLGGAPDGQARPDGQAAAEPLGQRDHVGGDAVMLVGEKRSGAAHPGLHLVEHQQGAVPRGDIARGGQVSLGRDDDAALPMIGSRNTAAVSSSTAAASAAASPYGT